MHLRPAIYLTPVTTWTRRERRQIGARTSSLTRRSADPHPADPGANPRRALGPSVRPGRGAVFLASSASDYINGHVLAVDGG
jgi:NAD(P)-dependent dehydrogenase (short-subunit alcohol dehydrogenase family)